MKYALNIFSDRILQNTVDNQDGYGKAVLGLLTVSYSKESHKAVYSPIQAASFTFRHTRDGTQMGIQW